MANRSTTYRKETRYVALRSVRPSRLSVGMFKFCLNILKSYLDGLEQHSAEGSIWMLRLGFKPSFWIGVSFWLDLGCDIGHDKGTDVLQDVLYIRECDIPL